MPAKAGIQAGRLRGCLVDSRFRGNDEFGTQLSSWAKPAHPSTIEWTHPSEMVNGIICAQVTVGVEGATEGGSEMERTTSSG
jgi:hypothetical protein